MLKCTVIFCTLLPVVLNFHHRFKLRRNSSEVLSDDYWPISDDVSRGQLEREMNPSRFNDSPPTLGLVRKTMDKGLYERLQQMKLDLGRTMLYPRAHDIIYRFSVMDIIPSVIDGGPKDFFTLSYRKRRNIPPGSGLSFSLVKNPPTQVQWEVPKAYTFYTLIFTRLRTSIAEHSFEGYEQHHNWIVCNIPGCLVRRGQVLLKYQMTPTDMLKTGHYVYLMLVFQQPTKIHPKIPPTGERFIINSTILGRENFTIKEFLACNDLYWPLAGHYYYVYF